MLVVLRGLKKLEKKKDAYVSLVNAVNYAITRVDTLKARNYPDAIVKRLSLSRQIDSDFQDRFMNILWDANMLSDGGYAFFNPADGKDSDSVVIKKNGRDTSNIH
jgi:hypothetical protein